MKSFKALRMRVRPMASPPKRDEHYVTLGRPAAETRRREKGERAAQLNMRVAEWLKDRIDFLADQEGKSKGVLMEAMLAFYEANGGGLKPGHPPVAEMREGRMFEVRFWGKKATASALGRIAAERGMSVSVLIEEWLAQEVSRLDPQGDGRFGIFIRRG